MMARFDFMVCILSGLCDELRVINCRRFDTTFWLCQRRKAQASLKPCTGKLSTAAFSVSKFSFSYSFLVVYNRGTVNYSPFTKSSGGNLLVPHKPPEGLGQPILAPAKAMPNFTHSPKDSRMKFRASVASVRLKGSADSVKAQTMPITLAKGSF